MRDPLRRLGRFLRRPWRDWWLFAQAWVLLGLARLAIDTVPFARLAGWLGERMAESPASVPDDHLAQARRVGWAVQAASRCTPWPSNCLPQAMTAKILLRRSGIASTLYLGAAFKARSTLEAHAWLRCGPLYVTGGAGHLRYGTVASFA